VEILDHYFNNVCELDLVFNFHKVLSTACTLHLQGLVTSIALMFDGLDRTFSGIQ
jgi:Clathrin adaptor complex small chain